jgi:Cu(I)/Ag(I) efflux system membrane fusion protein
MRKIIIFTMLLFGLTACDKVKFWEDKHSAEAAMHTYTCPMHPSDFRQTRQMSQMWDGFVLKDAPEKRKRIKLDDLLKPTNEFVVSEQPVIKVKRENIPTTVDALGTVEYDTRQIGSISSRVAAVSRNSMCGINTRKCRKGSVF